MSSVSRQRGRPSLGLCSTTIPQVTGDGRLVVDDVGGVHQRLLVALQGVGVELKHEHRTLAANHRLLRDGPRLTVLLIGAAQLPGLKSVERRDVAVTGALVAGKAQLRLPARPHRWMWPAVTIGWPGGAGRGCRPPLEDEGCCSEPCGNQRHTTSSQESKSR